VQATNLLLHYHTGKLTAEQVKSGYAALKKVEACINKGDFGDRLVTACNEFYTRIPHSFGSVLKSAKMVSIFTQYFFSET